MRSRQQLLPPSSRHRRDVDDANRQVVLTIQLARGTASQVRVTKPRSGEQAAVRRIEALVVMRRHGGKVVRRAHRRDTQRMGLPTVRARRGMRIA